MINLQASFKRTKSDVNGNPRFIINVFKVSDKGIIVSMNSILSGLYGVRKNKEGYVFSSYNCIMDLRRILKDESIIQL
jgi:hypothetical protein